MKVVNSVNNKQQRMIRLGKNVKFNESDISFKIILFELEYSSDIFAMQIICIRLHEELFNTLKYRNYMVLVKENVYTRMLLKYV
ncbi:MAG: hypothetical protein WC121_07960 [Candidatus Kapaibacterium sp.]